MATIHGCRWEWCRNVFNTHEELVYHIKSQHLLPMRPVTKRNAAAMLRAEGYTPEEVAVRLIPGYVAASQAPPAPTTNDPPHQAPESSPPTQEQPQLVPTLDTIPQPDSTEQPIIFPSPRTPTAPTAVLPASSSNQNTNQDVLMPPSSPPCASPTPSPKIASPARASTNDMSIDEIEPNIPKPPTDFLVPVSSPPPAATGRSSSVGSRTPRLKRRSSFSQMSSSPADEFTAPRYKPIPESPSMSMMIAERDRELKAKEAEQDRGREREKRNEKDRQEASRGRGSPVGVPETQQPGTQLVEKSQAVVSARGGIRLKRGRGRGRGLQGLQISTPGRSVPPPTAVRRVSPGLRIESRSIINELRQQATQDPVSQEQPTTPQSPSMDAQPALDATATADQMISQYTHADSGAVCFADTNFVSVANINMAAKILLAERGSFEHVS
ncbi:hypothetical protein FS749_016699 [Ceratobasidium sp. UAMH 11750]|nr:hypothetical protein FS749_016699 [Ceratobasidium sp. UAMH 11750]